MYYTQKILYDIMILVRNGGGCFSSLVKGGEDVIMADVVLLLTFAIVLTAVKSIIDDIKK